MFNVNLTAREGDGCLIAMLCGELDLLDAQSLTAGLVAMGRAGLPVVVGLGDLWFVDCRGLHALLCAQTRIRHGGGDLLLAAPQNQVMRVLVFSGLRDVFTVEASVDAAVQTARIRRRVLTQAR